MVSNSLKIIYNFYGKEKDDETGFSFFGARYYASELSIWLSVDPLAHLATHYSPYAFCFNNPLIYVDPDGQYPIYVLTRGYAPFKTFGVPRDKFYGDNSWHTLNKGASYRNLASINYDTETRQTSAFGGLSRSHNVSGTKDAPSRTNISDRSAGNSIDVHSFGNNAEQKGSWDIDQFTKLKVTTEGNIKKDHILNVSGTISGDDFPNQESMISEIKGNMLWLGNYETSGGNVIEPTMNLANENESDVNINIGIRVKVNKDGVYQGVMQTGKDGKECMISVRDWNKKFKSDDKK